MESIRGCTSPRVSGEGLRMEFIRVRPVVKEMTGDDGIGAGTGYDKGIQCL